MSSILRLPPTAPVTAAVEDLERALRSVVALVAEAHLVSLSEADLLAMTARLHRIASQADALAVLAVSEVREGEVAKAEGFTSTARWLEAKAGLSKGQSRAVVALGEKLQWEFEATARAWMAGDVSEGAVQVITSLIPRRLKGLPEVEYVAQRTSLEAMALHHARTRSVPEVRRAIERAAIHADPAGADAAVLAARDSQFLSFVPVQDGVEVRGFLTWEAAAAVMTAFDQCHDARYRAGALTEDGSFDADRLAGRSPGLRRQRRERRNAEIFAELATRLLDDGDLGSKHAQRPHVTVTVHADDYAAGLGGDVLLPGFGPAPLPPTTIDRLLCDAEVHPVLTRLRAAPPEPAPPSGQSPPGRSSAEDAAPGYPGSVPATSDPPWSPPLRPRDGGGWEYEFPVQPAPTAAQLESDTDLAAVVELGDDLDDELSWWNRFLGEPGRHVLDVGRSYRSAPPKLRRALAVRDGGCAMPDCDVDTSRCEAHHITYWEHGGDTSIANMVLLCSRHHHLVHEGGWLIRRDTELDPGDPGHITFEAPARCA